METYFWVNAVDKGGAVRFGPYLSFERSLEVMLEHIPEVLQALGYVISTMRFTVTEETIVNREWQIINVKVVEDH